MNNGLFTYLAALLLFGSNGIIAAAIALPSSDIVLLRTFLGALSLVTILAITQRHKLQAPSRPQQHLHLLNIRFHDTPPPLHEFLSCHP